MLVSVVRPRLSDVPRRHPLAGFRSEGWGPLLRESREARIAEARSRGFIVLRAQTWRGPDGRLSRRLTEDDPEDE